MKFTHIVGFRFHRNFEFFLLRNCSSEKRRFSCGKILRSWINYKLTINEMRSCEERKKNSRSKFQCDILMKSFIGWNVECWINWFQKFLAFESRAEWNNFLPITFSVCYIWFLYILYISRKLLFSSRNIARFTWCVFMLVCCLFCISIRHKLLNNSTN